MEFKPIMTQEELDSVIGERIKRERGSTEKKFEGWTSPEDLKKIQEDYDGKLSALTNDLDTARATIATQTKTLAERDAAIKGYETDSVKRKIAHENGIPYELAPRLKGEDEASIRKDAEALAKLIGHSGHTAPLASTEPGEADVKTAALKSTLAALKGE